MINAEGADFGGRRVIRTNMKTGVAAIIAGLCQGKPFTDRPVFKSLFSLHN